MHFGSNLSKGNWLRHCCDMTSSGRLRHIIWVGKHVLIFNIQDLGIRSSKVGLPSKASHLVSLSPRLVSWYSKGLHSKGIRRQFYFLMLKIFGWFRGRVLVVIKRFRKVKIRAILIAKSTLK